MPSAAALRTQIENALERRFPSALTPVARDYSRNRGDRDSGGGSACSTAACRWAQISELTGPESSRADQSCAFVSARRTPAGSGVCAWVDVNEWPFDAESAAASGVSLRQMLAWVRCRSASEIASGKPWTRATAETRASCIEEATGAKRAVFP